MDFFASNRRLAWARPGIAAAVMALAGCAQSPARNEGPGPAAQSTGLFTQARRAVDSFIAADRKRLDDIQSRLRRLNESGVPQNFYPLAKAQCWLDTASAQYHENDRTGYIEESLAESIKIIEVLETDKTAKVGYDTPLVARSTRLRDDLWARLNAFKMRDETLVCNARTVACGEVRLVRAGHAEQQTGWRQATPHVQMVEDAIRRANIEASNCQPKVAAAPAPVAAPSAAVPAAAAATRAMPVQPAASAPARESFVVLADALFRFDKSGRDDMLPGGVERLAAVAERLKKYRSIQSLTITGHTDRLGNDDYNDRLSQSRAETVRAHLQGLGINAAAVDVKGVGKRQPLTTNCSDRLPREDLVQCLQADRRVTIEVTGTLN